MLKKLCHFDLLVPLVFCLRMADDSGGGAAPPATPPAATPATGYTQADIDKAVEAALAKRDTEAQAKAAEEEAKKRGEFEKIVADRDRRLADAEARLASTLINNALLTAAAAGNAVDPGDVVALLAGKAKVSETGVVTVDGKPVAEAVEAFLKAKPHLAKAGNAGGGAPSGGGGDRMTKTHAEFSKLTPKEKMDFSMKGGKIQG